MLSPRPVSYGLNPLQQEEEEDGFQFVDVLKQLAGGFVQGFTTIDVVKEEPDNWIESLAQGIGFFAGFVGIIPGLGTAVSFGTKAGVRTTSAGIKLLGKTVGKETTEAVMTKSMEGIRNVTQPVVQKYYTQTRSLPFYAADLIMGMGKKALAGTPAEVLAKKVLMGPNGKRVIVEDIARGAMRMGLASGVSSWQGGIDQMVFGFGAGAVFGGADKGVANMLGIFKDSKSLRAMAGMMVNGLPSTLMDQPLEIQVFDYLIGAWFGTEMPYAQRKAMEALMGRSSVTSDGKRRYEAWLNPEENIPEYKNANELYGNQAENVRAEMVHQARMYLGSSLGSAKSGIASQIVSHAWFKENYDKLVLSYKENRNMTDDQANEAALDAIRKSPEILALATSLEDIDLRIKSGDFDVDEFTGEIDISVISDAVNKSIQAKTANSDKSKRTALDNIDTGLTAKEDVVDPITQINNQVDAIIEQDPGFVVGEEGSMNMESLYNMAEIASVDPGLLPPTSVDVGVKISSNVKAVKQIESDRKAELEKADLFHGTATKEEVLKGFYDVNLAANVAGQTAGAGLYLTKNKQQAKNYEQQAVESRKLKNQKEGKAETLYFNVSDFSILKRGEKIGKELNDKIQKKYNTTEISENTKSEDLFKLLYKLETGERFQATALSDFMIEVMVDLGIDGIEDSAQTVLYNFPKIASKEINAKYDAELKALGQAETKADGGNRVGEEVESRRIETEAKIKRKDLFTGVGDFSTKLGGSDKAAVPVSHKQKNGIEFVEYAHPETGSVDVIVTGKSDNDFVGFYRIYENGKPTNKWSSKFENQSRNKEDFKIMISGVQEMLPQGHEYIEKTSISTDGLRVWEQQLSRGYELQYDKNGKLITNLVAINGDAITNELGIPVQKGDFENIKVKSKEEFEVVKKALLPYLEKLGLAESDVRWLTGTVKINLPVLKSTKAVRKFEAKSELDYEFYEDFGFEQSKTITPKPEPIISINKTIEQPKLVPTPSSQIDPTKPIATDVVPIQPDPIKTITKDAVESTDTGRLDDSALIDDSVTRTLEDGYTGDVNQLYLNRVSPVNYVSRAIVSADNTILAKDKEARYNEIVRGIQTDYNAFMADGINTPYDFAIATINKYGSQAKIDKSLRNELVSSITQASRKMSLNVKTSQVIVDINNKTIRESSDKSSNGTPISVSKAKSHVERRLAETYNSNVQVIRLGERADINNNYDDPVNVFEAYDNSSDIMWVHHKMLQNGKAFMGHVKSNGELVYYDMIPATPDEMISIQSQIKELGLEDTYLNARQEYVDDVKKNMDINNDEAKALYDQYVVSQVKLMTEVLNPGTTLSEIAQKGFVNDFVAFNKRMQLIHGEGQWADERYFRNIEGAEAGFKFVILSSANKNDLTKRDGFSDDIFNIDDNGNVKEVKSETATDGAVIVRSDVFDEMVKDGGFDPESGVIKSIIAGNDNEGLGMLLSKHAMFRAGSAQDEFMKANGLHMVLRDTSAKQPGKRKIYDSQLGADNVFRIYDRGTTNETNIQDAVQTLPINAISYNLSTKESISSSLERQVLVSQLLGNLHNSKVDDDFISDIFEDTNGKAIRGNEKAIQAFEKSIVAIEKASNDNQASLIASKIDVDNLGIQQIIDVLFSKKGGNHVYNKVIRHILKSNIKEDPISYIAETEFKGKDLSASEKIILSIPENEIISDALMSNRNVVRYVDNKIQSYISNRIHSPQVEYSAKAIGLPTDEFNRGLVREGEFMLGQGSRAMKVKSRSEDQDMTLGELWDMYQAKMKENTDGSLNQKIKDLEKDLRMVVVRVPADSISGTRSLAFKGFYDNRGTGIALHSTDMSYMGGMDLDIDSTFIYQNLGKNTYGKSKKTLHDVLLENKDQWVKQVGDKKTIVESKNVEGARDMGVKPVPDNYKNVASLFDMKALTTVGLNATKGKLAVGSAASARTDISSWYSVAPNVLRISVPEKLNLPKGVKYSDVVALESVKKDNIREFDGSARQAMNYAADSSDTFDMIRPTQISNMLWGKAFDTYAVLKNGKRIKIDQNVKPDAYKSYKQAIDSTQTHRYTDNGVRKQKHLYEFLYSFRNIEKASDFKSKKAFEASRLNIPDPDIFSMAGFSGLGAKGYSKLIKSYRDYYTAKGVDQVTGIIDTQKRQRKEILESIGHYKSINSDKTVLVIQEDVSRLMIERSKSKDPERIANINIKIANRIDKAQQLISQDISDVVTSMLLMRQAEDVVNKVKDDPKKKEQVIKAITDIATQADAFKKAYTKVSSESANNQGKNKGEAIDGLQANIANFKNNVLQSPWQRKLFDTYMLGTFNVQRSSDIVKQDMMYKNRDLLSSEEEAYFGKLTSSIYANNLNSFGAFLKATGSDNLQDFYKAYSDLSQKLLDPKTLNKNTFQWMYKKIGRVSTDVNEASISTIDDLLLMGKNESLDSVVPDDQLSSSTQKNDISIDEQTIKDLNEIVKEKDQDLYRDCFDK